MDFWLGKWAAIIYVVERLELREFRMGERMFV